MFFKIFILSFFSLYVLYVYFRHQIPMFEDSFDDIQISIINIYSSHISVFILVLISFFNYNYNFSNSFLNLFIIILSLTCVFIGYPAILSIFVYFPYFTFIFCGIFGFFDNLKDIFYLLTRKKKWSDLDYF
jgi:hypothetical protein